MKIILKSVEETPWFHSIWDIKVCNNDEVLEYEYNGIHGLEEALDRVNYYFNYIRQDEEEQ